MAKERYIQIGVTSLRTPTGEFLPAVPLYIKTTEPQTDNGLSMSESAVLRKVADVFADRFNRGNNHVEI